MDEAICDTLVNRRFAGLWALDAVPEYTTSVEFRWLLEMHGLASQMPAVSQCSPGPLKPESSRRNDRRCRGPQCAQLDQGR